MGLESGQVTIRLPKNGPGDARRFRGSKGQAAANRLSHAWQQIHFPTQWHPVQGFCAACRVFDDSCTAQWPCGSPEVLGAGEYEY